MIYLKQTSDLELTIQLDHTQVSKESIIEVFLSFYPYTDGVGTDNYKVNPYEDYKKNDSHYKEYTDPGGILAGIAASLATASFYGCEHEFKDFFDLEQLGAIIGSGYFANAGRPKLERLLSDALLSCKKISYIPNSYQLILGRGNEFSELQNNAKKKRYGVSRISPDLLAFEDKSNSVETRMLFHGSQFENIKEKIVNIGSIQFESAEMLQSILQANTGNTKKHGFQFLAHATLSTPKFPYGPLRTTKEYLQELDYYNKVATYFEVIKKEKTFLGRLGYKHTQETTKEPLISFNENKIG